MKWPPRVAWAANAKLIGKLSAVCGCPFPNQDDVVAELPPAGHHHFMRDYETMYRSRLWTMRQYAGFSSAKTTNERFKLLLERGQMGLSVAFDLPTQLGLDADDELSFGEVAKSGYPSLQLKT